MNPASSRFFKSEVLCEAGAYLAAILIGLFAALIPYFLNHRFYFYNDEESFFYPYFLDIGHQLCHGHWPLLSLSTFCGGNFSIDWQLELFNPVSLLGYWLMASATNLELAGLCFAGFHIIMLALGMYVLARSFKLERLPSLVGTAVLATNNYLVFFYADAWISGLVSWCWFTWTWAALQSFRGSGSSSHLVAIVLCGYLTVTSGWPSTIILLAVLFAAYFVEMVLQEGVRGLKTVNLFLGGVTLALFTSPALLPAILSFYRTSREIGFYNHGFLTPHPLDLLNASSFFHMPQMRTYNAPFPVTPLLFLAWFLLPLLPLFDLKAAGQALSRRWALGIFGASALLLLFGPELLGPVRYPIRFLPGVDCALLLGFLLAATQPTSFVVSRWRIAGAVAVVLLGSACSVFSHPEFLELYVVGAVLSLLLLLIAIRLIQIGARGLFFSWLIFGVALGYVVTHQIYPSNLEVATPGADPLLTKPVSSLDIRFKGYSYYVGPNPSASQKHWSREFFFASEGIYQGGYSINGETTLNPPGFSSRVADSTWGAVYRPEAVAYLFSTDQETGKRIIELMRVNTLVLNKKTTAVWARPFLDNQWTEVGEGDYTVRFERSNPDQRATTLAWNSPGIEVLPEGAPSGESERLRVKTGAEGGNMVFARLWWPGYEARLDGQPLPVTVLDDLFLQVSLPSNKEGILAITYVPPGFRLGLFLAGVGGILLAITLLVNSRKPNALSS